MVRVLLIGNYPPDGQHSMLRYSAWLECVLNQHGLRADLLQPHVRFGTLVKAAHPARKWLGYLDKFLVFPLALLGSAGGYDVVHICDHSNAAYRLFAGKTPVALTCHDLIGIRGMLGEFDGQRPRWSGRLLQKWTLSSLKKIKFVCCVSESTRKDLERLAPRTDRQCRTTPNPVIGFTPMASNEVERELRQAGIRADQPFFLSIGTNLWYKNRAGMLRLFAETLRQKPLHHMRLVCAGAELSSDLRALISDLGIQSRVQEVLSPSPALLRALYTKAAALLFVSLYEGFGWPIIEAQACGCPVITSDREPMRSIAGEPALTVDPTLPIEAARTIGNRWGWLQSQNHASVENSARFSERQAAEEYLAFYDGVLKQIRSDTVGLSVKRVL